MSFGRRYPLRNADGETSAAGTSTTVTPVTAAPSIDAAAIKAAERKALLEELGIKDPEEAKAALKAAKDAADARMSEAERTVKQLKEAAAARAAAEAESEKLRAEIKAQKAESELREKLDAADVKATSRAMVRAIYLAEKDAKGREFSEEKFFEELRAEHPTLFRSGAVAPANTSPAPVAAAASPFGAAPNVFDALKATPEERRERRRSLS